MKAQMSFEFMLYAAIALASIAASLSVYMYSDHALLSGSASALDEEFATAIEAHMAYYSSTFRIIVPKGACQLGGLLPDNVHISDSLCNSSSGMAEVLLTRELNGSYWLSGG